MKICVAVSGDISELLRIQSFEPRGFIELSDITKQIGVADTGLQRLCANLLGVYLSKKE